MKPTASTLAVGYLRVSSVGQVEGDGFARQAEAIDRFAAKAGFSIVESYREAGVSGTAELDNRPALPHASREFSATVFVSSLSRKPTAWLAT